MAHPLEKAVRSVRRRARRLMLLYGLCMVAAVAVVAAAVVAGLDYLLRPTDPGLRLVATATVLAATGWAIWWFLIPAVFRRLNIVEIALRVERRFPQLGDRLATTIEFLRQSEADPTAGSAQLRRSVIARTQAEVESLDLSSVLQPRAASRAAWLTVVVIAAAAGIVVLAPLESQLALARLVHPLGDDQWPRINDLAFRTAPSQIAFGKSFEAELFDRNGQLPDSVQIHYRYDNGDGTFSEQVEPMRPTGESMMAAKHDVTRPFEYRAVGGDDDTMPWTELEIVEPPRIESLSLRLHPPEYTGWPVEPGERFIQALVGTRIQVQGSSSKPLVSATLKRENAEDVLCQISDDGHTFTIAADVDEPWQIAKSGKYWFELRDAGEVPGGVDDRWDVRAVEDRPPSVSIEEPVANLFVTAAAQVPLRIVAKEDAAIRDVKLVYTPYEGSAEAKTTIDLFTGPAQVTAEQARRSHSSGGEPEVREVHYVWNLAPLKLSPGMQVNFLATASDYRPQTGESPARRLVLITPRELEDRIAQRQSFILGELSRALKMQRDAQEKVRQLRDQLVSVGQLRKDDIDQLQAAELNQRQVRRTLADASEGLLGQVQGLLDELSINQVDSPQIERRMRQMRDELAALDREALPAAGRELTAALKAAQAEQSGDAARQAIDQPLERAGQSQEHVVATLEQLLGDLSKWDSYQQFYRDVGQLRRDQEDLERRVSELAQGNPEQAAEGTLGKDYNELTLQQQTDLKKLAQSQTELARRLEKTLSQMDQTRGQLQNDDPLAADALGDALHHARQEAISGQMRRAAGQIDRNQVADATAGQDRSGKQLQEMLDILQNRREQELSRLVKKLREAEAKLNELRQKQKGLQKKIDEAQQNPVEQERKRQLQRLAKEQQDLEEEARRMARQLMRLEAQRASQAVSQAAAKMGQAGQSGQRGDGAAAGEQSQHAQQDLDEAQQQLAQARQQAEQDLAREQLARLEDTLRGLNVRQQVALAETERLDGLRDAEGHLDRGQLGSLAALARQQAALRDEVVAVAEKLVAAAAFNLVLQAAGEDMRRAAARLEREQTGAPTQQAQQAALSRFAQILQALAEDAIDRQAQEQGSQPPGDSPSGSPGGQQSITSLAEIKLVKIMQQDLNRRTAQLDAARRDAAQLTPEQEEQFLALGEEQNQLADLVLNLTRANEAAPEDDPSQLPELRGLPGERPEPAGAGEAAPGDLPPLGEELPPLDLRSLDLDGN